MSAVNNRHRTATLTALALAAGLLATAGTVPASAAPAAPAAQEGQDAAKAVTSSVALKRAVYAYSKAFLGDEPVKAYNLLTPHCRATVSLSYFTGIVTAAGDLYGPQRIQSYDATVSDNRARATYS
jgi:hypothetical protein